MTAAIRRVTDPEDPARGGFVDLYRTAFGGPPYHEEHTAELVVRDVWRPHVTHCLVLAEADSRVVGFGCVVPLLECPNPGLRAFLRGQTPLGPTMAELVYMSEMAVDTSQRGKGLGTALVRARARWAHHHGFTHFIVRTASSGSSAGLYQRLGAQVAPFVQHLAQDTTRSPTRRFLWGPVAPLVE